LQYRSTGRLEVIELDLSDVSSVDDFAEEVLERLQGSQLDGLVNNAAIIDCDGRRNEAGVDLGFATNALGPQQLTQLFLPKLTETPKARIITVGSRLESQGRVDPSSLVSRGEMWPAAWGAATGMKAYASTKLCNQLMNLELCRRLEAAAGEGGGGPRVVCLCVSPGMVDTELWRNYPQWYQILTLPFRKAYLRSPAEAARGVVHCTVDPAMEVHHGGFLYDGALLESSASGRDAELAKNLWAAGETMIQKARLQSQLGLWPAAGQGGGGSS